MFLSENNASQSDHNFYLHGDFAYCEGHRRYTPCLILESQLVLCFNKNKHRLIFTMNILPQQGFFDGKLTVSFSRI